MSEQIVIKEVAARDGLQAQPKHLTVEQRRGPSALLNRQMLGLCLQTIACRDLFNNDLFAHDLLPRGRQYEPAAHANQ